MSAILCIHVNGNVTFYADVDNVSIIQYCGDTEPSLAFIIFLPLLFLSQGCEKIITKKCQQHYNWIVELTDFKWNISKLFYSTN